MNDDPIVASVRKIRDELAAAFDYDVHEVFADLRRRETGLGDRLVMQSQSQRPNQTKHPSGGPGDSQADASSAAG
jgi:hypothetical protein